MGVTPLKSEEPRVAAGERVAGAGLEPARP